MSVIIVATTKQSKQEHQNAEDPQGYDRLPSMQEEKADLQCYLPRKNRGRRMLGSFLGVPTYNGLACTHVFAIFVTVSLVHFLYVLVVVLLLMMTAADEQHIAVR